ncbi:hypothetical protein [Piscinibacter sp.]|uniref:hypothetical protein n=1 Tax=Piscinibacter sp. TaxID=1903157 RepID=UPI001DEEB546|nr:hypothetical protein [Piscinibacter sp.]MBK7530335.1 hypothetical protein [Piscinibacter sp.]
MPSTQTYVDTSGLYDSVNGLFVKLAGGDRRTRCQVGQAAAAAPDIDKQINDTREIFKLCR